MSESLVAEVKVPAAAPRRRRRSAEEEVPAAADEAPVGGECRTRNRCSPMLLGMLFSPRVLVRRFDRRRRRIR